MAFAGVLIVAAVVVVAGNNIVNPTTGLCLDIYAPCVGGQEEDGCERVEAKDIQQGAGMQAWRCHNEENQNFEVIGGRLRNKATGLCVDIRLPCRDGSEAEDCERAALQDIMQVTTLQMLPCLEGGHRGEEGSQIWDFLENGLIKHEDTGLCMDIRAHIVEGGARAEPEDVQEESPIQIYSCHSEGNQLFDFERGDLAEQVGDEVVGGLSAEEAGKGTTTSANKQTAGTELTTPRLADNITTTGHPSNTTETSAASESAVIDADELAAGAANGTSTAAIQSGNSTSTYDTTTEPANPSSPTRMVTTTATPATTTTAVNDSTTNSTTASANAATGSTTDTPANMSTSTTSASNSSTAGGSTSEIDASSAPAANETDPAARNGTPSQDYFWYAGNGTDTGSNATNATNDTTNGTSGEGAVLESDEFFELVGTNLRKPQGLLPVRVALGAAGACALAAGILIMARVRRSDVDTQELCLEAQGMMSSVE